MDIARADDQVRKSDARLGDLTYVAKRLFLELNSIFTDENFKLFALIHSCSCDHISLKFGLEHSQCKIWELDF